MGVDWPAFLLVVGVMFVVPGPDFALVLRHAGYGGAVRWAVGGGIVSGLCVHATAAALGISALLAASAEAFTVVKVLGAAYLVYLGVAALLAARRSGAAPTVAELAPCGRASAYRRGLLCNVLNPKAVLTFTSLLPQFMPDGRHPLAQTALMSGVVVGVGLAYWTVVLVAIGALARVLSRARVRRVIDRVAGGSLIVLGVHLLGTPL
ncbi:LysE family translocator [Solihabitans fulvus]|uniref:LysE family translocator n=1 Tax=Solihabitans fulvus TaxID=1892852 RepID=A0A5B2WP36_9PSEU|nr:LysE family translocator [Solihabitans fulvus]KAA2252708.1 LysE family translocator [Solihabitans fulvus]